MSPRAQKIFSFFFALSMAALAMAFCGAVYLFREEFVEKKKPVIAGEFDRQRHEELFQAGVRYAEKRIKPEGGGCVSRWLGRDQKYVYLTIGCAKFIRQYGEVRAIGDQEMRAVRLRYFWGRWVFEMKQTNSEWFNESLRYLYPPEAIQAFQQSAASMNYFQEAAKAGLVKEL